MAVKGLSDNDLRARFDWSKAGRISLDDQRMILIHTKAMGSLRKELIDTLGLVRARGALTRMGYSAGLQDAELAGKIRAGASDPDKMNLGPQLHALEGIADVTPINLDINLKTGKLYGEFLWEGSYEAEVHRDTSGLHTEPVCWMQVGYACGYTTGLMGKPVLFKEVECSGKGDRHCRIVGRPLEDWPLGAEDPDWKFLKPDPVAEQIVELQRQVEKLRYSIAQQMTPGDIVGESKGFQDAFDLVKKAATSEVTVLLLGETGVGKELFARALHDMSPRARAPFIAVNCAALPEELIESELFGVEKGAYTGAHSSRPGRFERAHGGTLFLDEIGELSPSAEAKLLRVLEAGEIERIGDTKTRRVDVRLVAATNRDLQRLVRENKFRSDLFFRINIYPVLIPPLRDRRDDIPLLVQRFLDKHSGLHGKKVAGITEEASKALLGYGWPGNIRELENVIERGVILTPHEGRIDAAQLFFSLPDAVPAPMSAASGSALNAVADLVFRDGTRLDDLETRLLHAAVAKAGGNLSQAARLLGLTRPQLAYRLKKSGADAPGAA